jgi:hypothetical protein
MQIEISKNAKKELNKRDQPLNVELELYFSCLIRKRVLILEKSLPDGIQINSGEKNLNIQFRPVMTKACQIEDFNGNDPAVERFPIVHGERFFPKWFRLDFKKGKWNGEFGYNV